MTRDLGRGRGVTSFAVCGYASLDHALALDRTPRPDRTAVVRERLSDPWPGQGGCAPYTARALARAGCAVTLLSWLGDDAAGRDYAAALEGEGVGVDGVEVVPGARTASSWLLYDPGGGTSCVYDPGGCAPAGLTRLQLAAVEAAAWTVLAVGPEPVNRALVAALPPAGRLVFAVKADRDAFPADLVRACLARADVVAFSRGERDFLEESAGAGALRAAGRRGVTIETRGRDGVTVTAASAARRLAVDAVPARDTTGAGDTLLGAALARLAGAARWPPGVEEAASAVAGGMEAARDLLRDRTATKGSDQ